VKAKLVLTVLVGLAVACCLCAFSNLSAESPVQQLQNMDADPWNVTFTVEVFNVDDANRQIEVRFQIEIDNFPFNASEVNMWVVGGRSGEIARKEVKCTREMISQSYNGSSNRTVWRIFGSGENFPFDSYESSFTLASFYSYVIKNITTSISEDLTPQAWEDNPFEIEKTDVSLKGESQGLLMSTWRTGENGEVHSQIASERDVVVQLERNPDKFTLQFILPTIACYYLLGGSVLIERGRSSISSRLEVYIPLFIYAPTFLFAIQDFLPFRLSLSMPEFLLTNLVLSSAFFAFFSMLQFESRILDLFPVLLSIASFLWLYLSRFFTELPLYVNIILVATVIIGYMIGTILTPQGVVSETLRRARRRIASFVRSRAGKKEAA